jgi:hypothetical protein
LFGSKLAGKTLGTRICHQAMSVGPEAAARLLASTLISSMYMVAMHGQPDACVVLLIVPKTELYEMCCMHLIFVHMNCLLCDLGIRKTKKVNPKN